MFTVGAAEIDKMLLFRDRLRADDADRGAYLQVKRDLAERTWRHVQHSVDSKTAIVAQIMARAAAASRQDQPGERTWHAAASRLDGGARDRRGIRCVRMTRFYAGASGWFCPVMA